MLHNICAMHVQVVVMTVTLQDSIKVPQVIVENSLSLPPRPPLNTVVKSCKDMPVKMLSGDYIASICVN